VDSFNSIKFAAIDFESSGFGDDGTDEPIQIGIAAMENGEIDPKSYLREFISPQQQRPISDAAYAVHRIAAKDLIGAPKMISLWPDIRRSLSNKVVVAHGAGTEKRFLRAFPLHGFKQWVDTLKVARTLIPDAPSHSLGDLIKSLDLEAEIRAICPSLSWHDALYDAVASLVLLRFLIRERLPPNTPLDLIGIPIPSI
jgi:DNA polymerase-3 subunit epsilon